MSVIWYRQIFRAAAKAFKTLFTKSPRRTGAFTSVSHAGAWLEANRTENPTTTTSSEPAWVMRDNQSILLEIWSERNLLGKLLIVAALPLWLIPVLFFYFMDWVDAVTRK